LIEFVLIQIFLQKYLHQHQDSTVSYFVTHKFIIVTNFWKFLDFIKIPTFINYISLNQDRYFHT